MAGEVNGCFAMIVVTLDKTLLIHAPFLAG